jgi:hypothetical protein
MLHKDHIGMCSNDEGWWRLDRVTEIYCRRGGIDAVAGGLEDAIYNALNTEYY